jgi:hypothetical protein
MSGASYFVLLLYVEVSLYKICLVSVIDFAQLGNFRSSEGKCECIIPFNIC